MEELDQPRLRPGSTGATTIDIVLPAQPRSVSKARHAVARLLHGFPQVPVPVAEKVLLLVSELVTNAVVHARTETRVSARVQDGMISVAVGDDDPHHAPELVARGSSAVTGRGVRMVNALASDWGVDLGETSKVVWFHAAYGLDTSADALDPSRAG